jgi:DNA-binding SARP family transcriptional activator
MALTVPAKEPTSTRLGPTAGSGVRLALLRGFELRCDGHTVPLVLSAQRLVAFLALHERLLPRTYVAETLWTDVPDRRAWGNLRSTLWRLGRLRERVVEQFTDQIQLACEVVVDVREGNRVASRLMAGDDVGNLSVDQRAFEGELLPAWCDEWILTERERHRQLSLHALELLCEHLAAEGQYGRAVQAGLAAVNAEPLRESAHRALIGVHLAEGNANEAIRQYELFDHLIRDELDLRPSDQLNDLITALRGARLAEAATPR